MTQAEFTERYIKFMREYEATLPAEMPQEEKQRLTLAAVEEIFNKDEEAIAVKAEEDLDHIFDGVRRGEPARCVSFA